MRWRWWAAARSGRSQWVVGGGWVGGWVVGGWWVVGCLVLVCCLVGFLGGGWVGARGSEEARRKELKFVCAREGAFLAGWSRAPPVYTVY